ncbi:MAG: hypothetical protein JWP27_3062, partial [Flaviaesturariibacter sp.]|nr:hypothetical protein [Flaviaesturariibacter sp.]
APPAPDAAPAAAAPAAPAAPAARAPATDASLFGDMTFASLDSAMALPDRPRRRVTLAVARESKAAADDTEGDSSSSLDEGLAQETEAEVTAALAAIAERQIERAVARLKSPRERKGTRHWTPEFTVDTRVGTKALDAPRIAGEGDDLGGETSAVRAILDRSGASAALGLLGDLTGFKGDAPPARVLRRLSRTVDGAMRLVNDSVRLQRQRIADAINRLDQAGKSVEEIVAALREMGANWSEGLSVQAVTATLEGAREDAATVGLTPAQRADITRRWRSLRDDSVRISHQRSSSKNPTGADGQTRALGEPFLVGGASLRYPGDPEGPPRETANCRCRIVFTSKASGRFQATPAGEITRRPA